MSSCDTEIFNLQYRHETHSISERVGTVMGLPSNQYGHGSNGNERMSILPLMMYKGFLKHINIHS